MKIDRTKNASRNIFFGLILKIYQVVVPFLMRTAMIYLMGVQYLGLNSLFVSVLQVLNLTELGVGSAMVYSMYRPIAEDDDVTICALMKLYRTYYRIIGGIIAVVGIVITPFIPKLITGTVPSDINIYLLYLLNLSATVISYWLFAYRNSILQAYQRNDIISRVSLLTSTIQYSIQIVVLWIFKNYYYYVIIMLVTQVINNVVTAIVANRLYPQYKPIGNVEQSKVKDINKRIRDLFTSKVGAVVYNSTDTIVISAFLGLTVLAVYQNYFYIINALTGFITVIFVSCTAGIGNSIVTETKEKNFNDFQNFTFIICWIAGVCSACLLSVFQPFMELWVGKDLMLSFSVVICFVIYFFVIQLNSLFCLYKDASGMWHEDRYRPLIASLTNLVLNIILVQIIGIYGIIFSTVLAIACVGMPWLMHNLFSIVFSREYLGVFLKKLLKYMVVVILTCIFSCFICSMINLGLVMTVLLRGVVCCIISNTIFWVLLRNTNEFKQALSLANSITKGKLIRFFVILGMTK